MRIEISNYPGHMYGKLTHTRGKNHYSIAYSPNCTPIIMINGSISMPRDVPPTILRGLHKFAGTFGWLKKVRRKPFKVNVLALRCSKNPWTNITKVKGSV